MDTLWKVLYPPYIPGEQLQRHLAKERGKGYIITTSCQLRHLILSGKTLWIVLRAWSWGNGFFLWSSQQRGTEFPVFPLVGPSKFKYNSIDADLIDSGWPIERKPSGPACYSLTHQESLMAKI